MAEQRIMLHAQGPITEPLHLVAEVWKDTGLIISIPEPHKSLAIVDEVCPIDNIKEGTVRPGVIELGTYYTTLELAEDRSEFSLRFKRLGSDVPEVGPSRVEVLEKMLMEVRAWARTEGCATRRGLGTYGDAYRDAKEDVLRLLEAVVLATRKPPCGICVSCDAVHSCVLPLRVAGEEVGRCPAYLGPLLQQGVPFDVRKG